MEQTRQDLKQILDALKYIGPVPAAVPIIKLVRITFYRVSEDIKLFLAKFFRFVSCMAAITQAALMLLIK